MYMYIYVYIHITYTHLNTQCILWDWYICLTKRYPEISWSIALGAIFFQPLRRVARRYGLTTRAIVPKWCNCNAAKLFWRDRMHRHSRRIPRATRQVLECFCVFWALGHWNFREKQLRIFKWSKIYGTSRGWPSASIIHVRLSKTTLFRKTQAFLFPLFFHADAYQ